jgi:hypothetical protein
MEPVKDIMVDSSPDSGDFSSPPITATTAISTYADPVANVWTLLASTIAQPMMLLLVGVIGK